jgi:hypothetical protein
MNSPKIVSLLASATSIPGSPRPSGGTGIRSERASGCWRNACFAPKKNSFRLFRKKLKREFWFNRKIFCNWPKPRFHTECIESN